MLSGRASASLSRQNASQAASRSGTSPREPSSCTPARPAASDSSASRSGPSPTSRPRSDGTWSRAAETASTKARPPFSGRRLATQTTAKSRSPSASSARTRSRGRVVASCSSNRPFGTTTIRSRAVAALAQRLALALADGDHAVHARTRPSGQSLLVRAQREQLAVGRERRVLVEDVGGAGAPGDRLADQLGADAAGDHGARVGAGLAERAAHAGGVGAAAQVRGRSPARRRRAPPRTAAPSSLRQSSRTSAPRRASAGISVAHWRSAPPRCMSAAMNSSLIGPSAGGWRARRPRCAAGR